MGELRWDISKIHR